MNEKPSFRVTKEEIEISHDVIDREEENEAVFDLDESQRKGLRTILLALGVALAPMKEVGPSHELEQLHPTGPVVSKIVESKRKGDIFPE